MSPNFSVWYQHRKGFRKKRFRSLSILAVSSFYSTHSPKLTSQITATVDCADHYDLNLNGLIIPGDTESLILQNDNLVNHFLLSQRLRHLFRLKGKKPVSRANARGGNAVTFNLSQGNNEKWTSSTLELNLAGNALKQFDFTLLESNCHLENVNLGRSYQAWLCFLHFVVVILMI